MVENLYIGNNPKGATELIKKFNANPDSNSGIVTVPKVIGAGESVTIPAGRIAILPNIVIEGELNIEDDGEIFIPAGVIDRIGLIDYGYIAKPYHIVAFGGEFNRTDYPKLWAYLQANPTLLKTQAEWTTENTTNGMCGYFSDGDGTTTFRVPNLDKAFLRPDSRGVGSFQGDAIRNITGIFKAWREGATTSGAFVDNGNLYGAVLTPGSAIHLTIVSLDASLVVPTANENRPKNIAVLPLIVAK